MKKQSNGGASSAPPRKQMRFAPKVPARKLPKPELPKTEPTETKDDIINKELLSKINSVKANDGFGRRPPKAETKLAPAQVAFGHGKSMLARSFGNSKGGVPGTHRQGDSDASVPKLEKEYVEPWDYSHSYYPVTLPLRRPYSGNPEIINEQEFGEASASSVLDETQINPAKELGLMENIVEPEMLFFQLPATLPLPKQRAAAGPSTTVDDKDTVSKKSHGSSKDCKLDELPAAGFMGKMLVYKSGIIKMKLGDAIFDVSPGSDCAFAQDVAAINTNERHCCILGELSKRAVVTPDVESLLDNINEMDLAKS